MEEGFHGGESVTVHLSYKNQLITKP